MTNSNVGIIQYIPAFFFFETHKIGKIHVTGMGGELFRWDWPRYEWLFAGKRKKINANIIVKSRFNSSTDPLNLFKQDFKNDLKKHFFELIINLSNNYREHLNVPKVDFIWLSLRLHSWGGAFRTANSKIQQIYTPFLNKSLIELAFKIKYNLRKNNKIFIEIMSKSFPQFVKIPFFNGHSYEKVYLDNYLSYIYIKIKKSLSKYRKLYYFIINKNLNKNQAKNFEQNLIKELIIDNNEISNLNDFINIPSFNYLIKKTNYSKNEIDILSRIITAEKFIQISKLFSSTKKFIEDCSKY